LTDERDVCDEAGERVEGAFEVGCCEVRVFTVDNVLSFVAGDVFDVRCKEKSNAGGK